MGKKEILDFKIWSTSITRFNSAKRITSWKHCIRWSLLSSSVYLVTLSILIYAEKIQSSHLDESQFASIFLSILVMSLSLSVNLNNLEIRAFQYHECGRKIRRLTSKLAGGNQSQGGQSQAADLIHSRSGCCSLNEAFIAFTST